MKVTPAIVALALAAGPGVAAQPDRPVHRDTSSTQTLSFDAAGPRTVDLRTINGRIRITTENRVDVRLTAARHTDAEREQDLPDADRDVRLVTHTTGAAIVAAVHDHDEVCGEPSTSRRRESWWERRRYDVRVDLTATVPAGTRLRVCTINGDEIAATGNLGDVDVSNVNGEIELSGVHGSGRVSTVNGAVNVTFAEAPRDASAFKTVNGDVTVTFPRDLSADLRLKTFHGELWTDFETQPLPVAATRTTSNGRYVYQTGGVTRVRVGRGGPELSFETLNGDVRILHGSR